MRRRILRARGPAGKLTEPQIMHLMQGFTLCNDRGFGSEDEARAAWFAHRSELMAMVKDEPDLMGYVRDSRPWAWFRFEAKKPRRKSTIPGRVALRFAGE